MKLKQFPKPELKIGEEWCDSNLVTYPVSYEYNGGIIIDGEYFHGVEVPKPDVPEGFEIVGIGVGLQLNCIPPIATRYLRPIKKEKKDENCEK